MAWIRVVPLDRAQGRLKAIYDASIKRSGKVFGIVRSQSLDPPALSASMALYTTTTTTPRAPLSRWFRELIGVTVSRLNECHY